MNKIGFVGLGSMGLPMAINMVKKSGLPVIGFDVVEKQLAAFSENGGTATSDVADIYGKCDLIFFSLPTTKIVEDSIRAAVKTGHRGDILVDLSSTAPDVIKALNAEAEDAGISLLDAPVSGGNPLAIAGKLAVMVGGDRAVYDTVLPIFDCIGIATYTGASGSGNIVKLVNNLYGGIMLTGIAEAYAFAAKAGVDLDTVFQATRHGFAGGPCYDNKVPKIINRDYEPGGRVAIHRKDIQNAKHLAHQLGIDLPLTDQVLSVMDWMEDNGYINEDQAALVRYYEKKMNVEVGQKPKE